MSKSRFFLRSDFEDYISWVQRKSPSSSPLDRFILQWLEVQRNELILDNGAGNGRFSIEMGRLGAHVIAIDLNKDMTREARRAEKARKVEEQIQHVIADSQHLPFKDRMFDRVLCVHNLWYIPGYSVSVKEMARTTKKDGFIVFDHVNLLSLRGFLGHLKTLFCGASCPIFYRTPKQILKPIVKLGNARILITSQVPSLFLGDLMVDLFGGHRDCFRFNLVRGVTPFALRLIVRIMPNAGSNTNIFVHGQQHVRNRKSSQSCGHQGSRPIVLASTA